MPRRIKQYCDCVSEIQFGYSGGKKVVLKISSVRKKWCAPRVVQQNLCKTHVVKESMKNKKLMKPRRERAKPWTFQFVKKVL